MPNDGKSVGELEVRGPWITADVLRRRGARPGEVPRRLAAHRRRRRALAGRLPDPHRPGQGRHQVRRRVDQLGRAGERADGPPGGAGGLRRRRARTSGGASVRSRRWWSARAHVGHRRGAARLPRPTSVARWQLPERWAFIEAVPKTSVGKFDKKVLRAQYADGELSSVSDRGRLNGVHGAQADRSAPAVSRGTTAVDSEAPWRCGASAPIVVAAWPGVGLVGVAAVAARRPSCRRPWRGGPITLGPALRAAASRRCTCCRRRLYRGGFPKAKSLVGAAAGALRRHGRPSTAATSTVRRLDSAARTTTGAASTPTAMRSARSPASTTRRTASSRSPPRGTDVGPLWTPGSRPRWCCGPAAREYALTGLGRRVTGATPTGAGTTTGTFTTASAPCGSKAGSQAPRVGVRRPSPTTLG